MASFTCVLIPESDFEAIRTISLSTAGGLEKDELQRFAKDHLKRDSDGSARMESLQMHMKEAGTDISTLNPQMLASIGSMGTSLEITSLQMPTPSNGYIGVSMYSDGNAIHKEFKPNTRATRLARTCGHSDIVLHGDCFLGRCYDNEEEEWVRRSISDGEADVSAAWVLEAAKSNSNRDLSKFSTSGALGASMGNILGKNNINSSTSNPFAAIAPQGPVINEADDVVSWTQHNDEIEIKIKVDASVTTKLVKLEIHPTYLRLRAPVLGVSELAAALSSESGLPLLNRVSVDDSSWSLEGSGATRCLTVTLATNSKTKWTSLRPPSK